MRLLASPGKVLASDTIRALQVAVILHSCCRGCSYRNIKVERTRKYYWKSIKLDEVYRGSHLRLNANEHEIGNMVFSSPVYVK